MMDVLSSSQINLDAFPFVIHLNRERKQSCFSLLTFSSRFFLSFQLTSTNGLVLKCQALQC